MQLCSPRCHLFLAIPRSGDVTPQRRGNGIVACMLCRLQRRRAVAVGKTHINAGMREQGVQARLVLMDHRKEERGRAEVVLSVDVERGACEQGRNACRVVLHHRQE